MRMWSTRGRRQRNTHYTSGNAETRTAEGKAKKGIRIEARLAERAQRGWSPEAARDPGLWLACLYTSPWTWFRSGGTCGVLPRPVCRTHRSQTCFSVPPAYAANPCRIRRALLGDHGLTPETEGRRPPSPSQRVVHGFWPQV